MAVGPETVTAAVYSFKSRNEIYMETIKTVFAFFSKFIFIIYFYIARKNIIYGTKRSSI